MFTKITKTMQKCKYEKCHVGISCCNWEQNFVWWNNHRSCKIIKTRVGSRDIIKWFKKLVVPPPSLYLENPTTKREPSNKWLHKKTEPWHRFLLTNACKGKNIWVEETNRLVWTQGRFGEIKSRPRCRSDAILAFWNISGWASKRDETAGTSDRLGELPM